MPPGCFLWFRLVFHGFRWVLWCSKFPGWVFIVPGFLWFRVDFMISHDYRLFFYGSCWFSWVFIVPGGFLWLFMIAGQFFMVPIELFMVSDRFSIIPVWFLWFFMVPGWFFSELSARGAKWDADNISEGFYLQNTILAPLSRPLGLAGCRPALA